jgi:hypothetical protein
MATWKSSKRKEWMREHRSTPEFRAKKNAQQRAWTKANPEKAAVHARRKYLKKQYGITIEEHDAILLSQGNRCKICRTDKPGRTGSWCVDHCHGTGDVRGILCHDCNLALGYVKDHPQILKAMIRYLYES